MASTLPKLPIFEAVANHDPHSPAVIHCTSGRQFTYGSLLQDVANAKEKLRQSAESRPVQGERIAFLVENGYDYVGAGLIGSSCCKGRLRVGSDLTCNTR